MEKNRLDKLFDFDEVFDVDTGDFHKYLIRVQVGDNSLQFFEDYQEALLSELKLVTAELFKLRLQSHVDEFKKEIGQPDEKE